MNYPQPRRPQRQQDARATEEDFRESVVGLEFAVFGFEGQPNSGLLSKMDALNKKMDRLSWALATASITFATGTVGIVITALLK